MKYIIGLKPHNMIQPARQVVYSLTIWTCFYIHDSYENEGINLNPDDIEVNPAFRSLAKLCLTSLWGKFGQNMNKNQHKYFSADEVDTFYQIIYSTDINMHNFHILDDNTICMEWYHATENVPDCTSSNIFLATMTTCWARLRLYNILELVGDRALYYDTDSVIYVDKPGHPAPPIGPHLGQLKSELRVSEYIKSFVSSGPKSYAYITNMGVQECKIKGVTLNFENAQKI